MEDACKKELIGQVCTTLNNAVKQLVADNIASNRAWTHSLRTSRISASSSCALLGLKAWQRPLQHYILFYQYAQSLEL